MAPVVRAGPRLWLAVNVFYGGGLGALMGLGIDALIQGRKDIYQRGASRCHWMSRCVPP